MRPRIIERPANERRGGASGRPRIRLRERHPELGVITLDVDWGCTVIGRCAPGRPLTIQPETLNWPILSAHRRDLLELVPATWAELARFLMA